MTLDEAYLALELEPSVDNAMLKEQYRWFVKFYHPDNLETGDVREFQRAVVAYETIKQYRH